MCTFNYVHDVHCVYTGTIIEGPSSVTYLPGLTPLPIELICNVTGIASWRVNNELYTLAELSSGVSLGHCHNGMNILIYSPVNNTEYICVSQINSSDTSSDPAYITVAGNIMNVAVSL